MVTAAMGLALGALWLLSGAALLVMGLAAHLLPGLASPVGGAVLAFAGLTAGTASALWLWTARVLDRVLPRLWYLEGPPH